ncbi:cilia- and flagella-associated protein 99 isoform X1 [Cygnus atratus]|uniref:cilia- and flagella-associated protein 99 isoform X1 n=1 Tax=Cygnus atratus TaxID=8868 RepID=UPI0015D60426|nr:cilia- and flagella-associated protein 99 isoform X1 [Cygnus atratus]XP_035403343.1 cilia- and flagella-associated protein 99 isoform X1 [Cygnus atratus]XP_035403344.1 cilia- and flagella-associated protein 99 isoform X1 [Cygnus atratus]XP_035403345.1 cilia- and flagella-associated protein 99 isoform X1 [Cygnus atratus]XP_050566526.1 cilia- and flagella-associated protein 99 isoform X1 [Cygnus atratus]
MVKMVSHGKHIAIIVQQLNKFNPENQSVEDFLNESAKMLQTLNVTEEKFVLDTLAGCIEYKSLLDVVVNAFFVRDGKYCLISERNLYVVICYLATFQLEELGLQHFSRIVKSLDTAKMHKFLRFFFNALYLNTWIKDEWSRFYDSLYVKENWIDPLLRWQPKVQQLIEHLTDKLSNRTTTVKTSTVTQPKEFNLTVPKPRAIPIPLPIPVLEKGPPVPPSTYKPPKEKKQLEEIKTKNRQKAEDLLLKANTNQFKCATTNPEKGESTHNGMKSRPAFRAQKIQSKIDNIPIKLNAAAILREGALYQRKMEQELKRIENLLQGAGDPSEFLEWQKQMRGKDLEEQLAEIECRRLQGKLSHEEAVLAHQNVTQENKKKADLMREEKAELMHQYAEKRLQEQKEMRELVEQVVEGHKNAKQAKLKLQKYKQQIVQEVCEENRELLRQALEEEEEKLRKRCELIQQIRAIESLPSLKHKFVDLTETGGHGLICEMSVVELRERLALLREAQKAAEEEKRDQIIHEKQAKEQLLLDKLDQISVFRAELGRAAALKQEEKKRKSQAGESHMKDERILNLQKKIVEKAMERKKQAGLLKITPQKTSITSRKDSLQWNHWKELEESRERRFKTLQYGFTARETAQKMAAYEAARSGATACILRSEVK